MENILETQTINPGLIPDLISKTGDREIKWNLLFVMEKSIQENDP